MREVIVTTVITGLKLFKYYSTSGYICTSVVAHHILHHNNNIKKHEFTKVRYVYSGADPEIFHRG